MNQKIRKELSSLLSAIVDGRAEDPSIARLNEILENDAQAQAYYLHYIAIHTNLESTHGSDAFPTTLTHTDKTPRYHLNHWVAAAACLALLCSLWFFTKNLTPQPSPGTSTDDLATADAKVHHPQQILAVIGNAENAQWDIQNIKPIQGTQLGKVTINLHQGRIRLDFPAGEKVTLAAPATFTIRDKHLLSLKQGKLIASVPEEGHGFTVIMPNGAVVDLGTEFAVSINKNGENHVKVLTGAVVASSTNAKGNTTWEETLRSGEEVSIQHEMPIKRGTTQHQYIDHLPNVIPPLKLSHQYHEEVKKSDPLGFWKFDTINADGTITDSAGNTPMNLGMKATINTHSDGGYLLIDRVDNPGFAESQSSFDNLNTDSGVSMEMWAYSSHMDWQSLAVLSLEKALPSSPKPNDVTHTPQLLLSERTGRSGSNIAHIHPDFALRSVYRSPAGYKGGTNIYTENTHLIHQWFLITMVRDQKTFRTYINGKLAAEARIQFRADHHHYKLTLGRLHNKPSGKYSSSRQWSGAIDEVSLYNRVLTPSEVAEHYKASGHQAQ